MSETMGRTRDVTEKERELWQRVRSRAESGATPTANAVEIGTHIGLHQTRARQFVQTWENEGLVISPWNNKVSLTEKGRETTRL